MAQQAFLFAPRHIDGVLASFPALAVALRDSRRPDEASAAFPMMRKSVAQIYRVLGNTDLEHVRRLLECVDTCRAAGFLPRNLLRTQDRSRFQELLTECRVAEHVINQGFTLDAVESDPTGLRIPEFVAKRGDLRVAVEVYTPRRNDGLSDTVDVLIDALKHLDSPLDYRFSIDVEWLHSFDEHGQVMPRDVLGVSRAFDAAQRRIAEPVLISAMRDGLEAGRTDLRIEHAVRDLNVTIRVCIDKVRPSRGAPVRSGCISSLGLAGHAPEYLFDKLVNRHVGRKARKRQASRAGLGASISALIVDLGYFGVVSELDMSHYRTVFERILRGSSPLPYDFIAFCESSTRAPGLSTHFLVESGTPPDGAATALFGELVTA